MKHLLAAGLAALLLVSCGSKEDTGAQAVEDMTSWNTVPPQPPAANTENSSDAGSVASGITANNEKQIANNDLADLAPTRRIDGCDRMFLGAARPIIVSTTLKANADRAWDERCYRAFAVGHAGVYRVPLWSAEVLTPQSIEMAAQLSRDSDFDPDTSIAEPRRAELEDYRRSGYDRGHLAPSADMPTRESQAQSFLLSNIVPQDRKLNDGDWAELEKNIRRQARRGKVYVVTGPIVQGSRQSLKQRVIVPTHLYKAIFTVGRGAVVYVAENRSNGAWSNYSVDQFAKVYGLDPFPALPARVRKHNMQYGPLPSLPDEEGEEGTEAKSSEAEVVAATGYARLGGENGTGPWITKEAFLKKYGRSARVDEIRF